MARMKVWREIVKDALLGHNGQPRTNAEVYKDVARIIGKKELTPNEKAKVRQQLQIVAVKPDKKKPRKKQPGKWKYEPKIPDKKKREVIQDKAENLGLEDPEFFEKKGPHGFFTHHIVHVFEYSIPSGEEGSDWISALGPIAAQLESEYGRVDTAIDFLVAWKDINGEEHQDWMNLAWGSSPTIAAGQAPAKVQEYAKKSGDKYHGAIEAALKVSFTLYIPT